MMGGWSWRVYARLKSFVKWHIFKWQMCTKLQTFMAAMCATTAFAQSNRETTPLITTSLCCKSIRCRNDLFYHRWIFCGEAAFQHETYTHTNAFMHSERERTPKKLEISLQKCEREKECRERVNEPVSIANTTQWMDTKNQLHQHSSQQQPTISRLLPNHCSCASILKRPLATNMF